MENPQKPAIILKKVAGTLPPVKFTGGFPDVNRAPLVDWRVNRRFTDRSCRVLRKAEEALARSGGGTLELVHVLQALLDEDARFCQATLPAPAVGPEGRGAVELLLSPERDPGVDVGGAVRMALQTAYS
ncbi:MAG: hypothetical protein LC772_06335, partial [Chloroflexi bacterium]|nr:hypothetical protein [Chloroflexota bacterium]